MTEELWFYSWQAHYIFSLTVHNVSGAHKGPISVCTRDTFPRDKWPGHGTDNSLLSTAEVKNAWRNTCSHSIRLHGVHRHTFTILKLWPALGLRFNMKVVFLLGLTQAVQLFTNIHWAPRLRRSGAILLLRHTPSWHAKYSSTLCYVVCRLLQRR
jgi:hypothetical protein